MYLLHSLLYLLFCFQRFFSAVVLAYSKLLVGIAIGAILYQWLRLVLALKVCVMPDKPMSNVKIYDRPEKKGPSPVLLIVGLLIALLVGFFLYKAFYHPAVTGNSPTGFLTFAASLGYDRGLL